MREQEIKMEFHSPLGELMSRFIREKQACGYRYDVGLHALRRLDNFLCESGLHAIALPRELIERWTAKRDHEQPGTQKVRITIVRQFALFVRGQGFDAHVPHTRQQSVANMDFTPYVFPREEVKNLLDAADHLPPDRRSPMRHLIMPEVFRLLYCCGMRVGEVLRLSVADVDLDAGVLTIRNAKFNKDRLLPLPKSMTVRLQQYAVVLGEPAPEAIFFPAPDSGPYSTVTVYAVFRHLLRECGIPHRGRGKGPRLHELRHAFAVHNLERWYRQGENLDAKLPLLAAYLGHQSLAGTQRYLRLTPEIFPDIRIRLENFMGHAIPCRRGK
jgi:integrase